MGSIIGSDWILTAAHCICQSNKFQIWIHSLDKIDTIMKVVHPQYDPNILYADIALLKLPHKLAFSEEIQPIVIKAPIISIQNQEAQVMVLEKVLNSSYSSDFKLRPHQINVKILENRVCERYYGTEIVTNATICAVKGDYSSFNIYQGHSGSPLVVYNSRKIPVQIGIVSFVSVTPSDFSHPSGYTKIVPYIKWIQDTTNFEPTCRLQIDRSCYKDCNFWQYKNIKIKTCYH